MCVYTCIHVCRLALQHGASLVPVYSFGENDLYEQADNRQGSRLRQCQNCEQQQQ